MNKNVFDKHTLLIEACKARHFARVDPLLGGSGFRVGAALLCEDGEIITGCDVELYSTRVSICAERTALVKAISIGKTKFLAIAVVSDADHPISPCAICRQFLIEFGLNMPVIMSNYDLSETVEMTIGELTPMPFIGNRTDL